MAGTETIWELHTLSVIYSWLTLTLPSMLQLSMEILAVGIIKDHLWWELPGTFNFTTFAQANCEALQQQALNDFYIS